MRIASVATTKPAIALISRPDGPGPTRALASVTISAPVTTIAAGLRRLDKAATSRAAIVIGTRSPRPPRARAAMIAIPAATAIVTTGTAIETTPPGAKETTGQRDKVGPSCLLPQPRFGGAAFVCKALFKSVPDSGPMDE